MIASADLDVAFSDYKSSPSNIQREITNKIELANGIRTKVDAEFSDLPKDVRKVLYITKYVVEDATISGY